MPKRVYKRLTPTKIRALKEPGRYADGDGLYLLIDAAGNKRWVARLVANGRRRDIGLGPLRHVSLAEAREQVGAIHSGYRSGEDPLADRARRRGVPLFEAYARELHETIKGEFRNEKHAAQWIRSLELYAFPSLGRLKLDQIDTKAVRDALLPIWFSKRESARRVRQRIGRVLDAAASEGLRTGENPVPAAMKGLPKNGSEATHFRALPYQRVPGFVAQLRAENMTPLSKLAFEFLILTAARTSEVLLAQWDEVDFDAALWTVPATRMKSAREHKVPLSESALAILRDAQALSDGSKWIFPGPKAARPFSNGVFLAAIKRMKADATAHGFRSAFRDWAEEMKSFPHSVKEAALAHVVRNKVEAAYRRTDLLEKRREMMADWGVFVSGG